MNIRSIHVVNMPYPYRIFPQLYMKAGIAKPPSGLDFFWWSTFLNNNYRNNAYDKPKIILTQIFFYAGLLTFSLGILLLFINYQRIGGFLTHFHFREE